MVKNNKKYCLINDDDGHWYIIPSNKRGEAEKYFLSVYRFWDEMPEDMECPEEPSWLEELNKHPMWVSFEDYEIE